MSAVQGYGDRNGAAQEEAWQLWGKAGLTDNFAQAWALSDVDRDGRLNEQANIVFMRHPALPYEILCTMAYLPSFDQPT